MKKSRILALLLVALLAFSAAACSNTGNSGATDTPTTSGGDATTPSETTPSTPTDTATNEPAADTGEEIAAAKTYDEHLTISWAFQAEQANINEDEFSQMWQEKFNLTWDPIPLAYDTWAERIRVWANAMDLPDACNWDYNHVDATIFAEQELVKRLPDGWKTKWPNLAAAFENSGAGPLLEDLFGGTYIMPRPIFNENKPTDPLVTHEGIYMRKDWMEAAGLEIKLAYTTEEIMEMARVIKETDPGNVGSSLIPIASGPDRLPQYFIYNNSTYSQPNSQYFQDANGEFQWGPAQPETLQGLKYYQQAYKEGLIHPEFYTFEIGFAGGFYDSFVTLGTSFMHQAAGMASVANRFGNMVEANFGAEQNLTRDDALHFGFTVDPQGRYRGVEGVNYWGAILFGSNISDEKLERILDVMDYACGDGYYEIRMGIPGVDWEWGADGELVSLMEPGMTAVDKYFSIRPFYNNLYILTDDFLLINPAIPKKHRDMSLEQYKAKEALIKDGSLALIDYDVLYFTSDARRRAEMQLYEEYAMLVIQDGDLEANWNNWVAEKMRLVQPVLDELNALKK